MKEYWIYYIIMFNLLIIMPSFIYLEDANTHWLLHLMSLSASRLFLPILLIAILIRNGVRLKQFLKDYTGLLFFLILCFLYFPTYMGDLQFIDKNDWFTVPAKLIVWSFTAGITLTNLINKKE